MNRPNIQVISLVGIGVVGLVGILAGIWFERDSSEITPTPSITREITQTPTPTRISKNTPTPKVSVPTVTLIPTPTLAPDTRPTVPPNPTPTLLPQSYTISLTTTTEHFTTPKSGKSTYVFICPPESDYQQMQNTKQNTEAELKDIDDEYVDCSDPYEQAVLECINDCSSNLFCMTGCEQQYTNNFQACEDNYYSERQALVDNAVNTLSASCVQQ